MDNPRGQGTGGILSSQYNRICFTCGAICTIGVDAVALEGNPTFAQCDRCRGVVRKTNGCIISTVNEVHERLFVGSEAACQKGSPEMAIVHACKSPCHQRAVGYFGHLPPEHVCYLVLEQPFDLYLSIIDPPLPLFRLETFTEFLCFAAQHYDVGRSLLIHSNQGESRAPSLALLFLAKHLHAIDARSFDAAAQCFTRLYPAYKPGSGIRLYLRKHWGEL